MAALNCRSFDFGLCALKIVHPSVVPNLIVAIFKCF